MPPDRRYPSPFGVAIQVFPGSCSCAVELARARPTFDFAGQSIFCKSAGRVVSSRLGKRFCRFARATQVVEQNAAQREGCERRARILRVSFDYNLQKGDRLLGVAAEAGHVGRL